MNNLELYLAAIAFSALFSLILTPLVRRLVLSLGYLDKPGSAVKTHTVATPHLGGVAVWLAFTGTLVASRLVTQFPTGTLRSLRAVVAGGALVFFLGLLDDITKPEGIHFKPKFAIQLMAAMLLVLFGIQVEFITPNYLAMALTVFWVVGITNAFNIIDIMDGLCASQAAIAAIAFLFIALPSEDVYVNVTAAALAGSVIGFLPWNFSERYKIFLGDSGSLLVGFVLAALSLGTDYSQINPLGVYAPLFILLVPMYDTFFVMALRMMRGRSPFLGSKDHFALRLEALGFSRPQVVATAALAAALLSVCAWLVTVVRLPWAIGIYVLVSFEIALLSWRLYQIEMR